MEKLAFYMELIGCLLRRVIWRVPFFSYNEFQLVSFLERFILLGESFAVESCLPSFEHWFIQVMQGGVTEEQMLKHLGANTTLMPKDAVRLLEVCISSIIILVFKSAICILFVITVKLVAMVAQF